MTLIPMTVIFFFYVSIKVIAISTADQFSSGIPSTPERVEVWNEGEDVVEDLIEDTEPESNQESNSFECSFHMVSYYICRQLSD